MTTSKKRADLSPPLGRPPAGPCLVEKRIRNALPDGPIEDRAVEQLKRDDLPPQVERAAYPPIKEPWANGPFKYIELVSHMQRRMDERFTDMALIKAALLDFHHRCKKLETSDPDAYEYLRRKMQMGDKIEHVARNKVKIVLQTISDGGVRVITTFVPGKDNPKYPSQGCKLADVIATRLLLRQRAAG